MSTKIKYEVYDGYGTTDCPNNMKVPNIGGSAKIIKVGSTACVGCDYYGALATALCEDPKTVACNFGEDNKEN